MNVIFLLSKCSFILFFALVFGVFFVFCADTPAAWNNSVNAEAHTARAAPARRRCL